MADFGENPKQQGESSEQRKGKGKRKVMESGSDEAGNESKGRRGKRSLGRTDEEKHRLKIESDKKFRAKKKAEFQRMQTSLELAFEKIEHMKAKNERSEKEKNEAEANVQMLQNLVKDMSTELQNMKAEYQRVNSLVDLLLNQNGTGNPQSSTVMPVNPPSFPEWVQGTPQAWGPIANTAFDAAAYTPPLVMNPGSGEFGGIQVQPVNMGLENYPTPNTTFDAGASTSTAAPPSYEDILSWFPDIEGTGAIQSLQFQQNRGV